MNNITIFANQCSKVDFYPASSEKKAYAKMSIAKTVSFTDINGNPAKMTNYYTVKAWNGLAQMLKNEDRISKFYKITGKLHAIKSKNGKTYYEIHADSVEVKYDPDVPRTQKTSSDAATEAVAA